MAEWIGTDLASVRGPWVGTGTETGPSSDGDRLGICNGTGLVFKRN